jgi:NADPH-dependent F420 reductase
MPSPQVEGATLAFVGGTGPEGLGLAKRFAGAGHPVVIGSRSPERAQEAALALSGELVGASITGAENLDAARKADLVVLTLPVAAVRATLPGLGDAVDGKIVVSAIAPIEFQDGTMVALRPEAGSVAQEVAGLLPGARVVSAFQTIDAHQLQDLSVVLDSDVVVCSDDQEARRAVVSLAGELPGVRALSGGRLRSSRYVEEITALLITVNRIYKVHSGFRLTGIDR